MSRGSSLACVMLVGATANPTARADERRDLWQRTDTARPAYWHRSGPWDDALPGAHHSL